MWSPSESLAHTQDTAPLSTLSPGFLYGIFRLPHSQFQTQFENKQKKRPGHWAAEDGLQVRPRCEDSLTWDQMGLLATRPNAPVVTFRLQRCLLRTLQWEVCIYRQTHRHTWRICPVLFQKEKAIRGSAWCWNCMSNSRWWRWENLLILSKSTKEGVEQPRRPSW